MAKSKVKEFTERFLEDFLKDKDIVLYNVEFVKEGRDWYLRVYLDKEDGENGEMRYISTDDCEMVSRRLTEKLDEEDPIEQNYYLEVSSPGLDRTFIKESDYTRFRGRAVEISLYKALDGKKNFKGILQGLCDGVVTLTPSDGKPVELPLDMIAKTKLEVTF